MRARAQARTQRFLNARERTLGVDKAALDRQVEEKRLAKLAEKQANADQFAYDQQVLRILESNEAESRAAKMAEMNALREDLLAQAQEPKNTCEKMGTPINPDDCSFAAGQRFAGEDQSKDVRIRQQQAQMRQWTRQQVAEKQARSAEVVEEGMRFHQYLSAVDQMRAEMEEAEAARVKAEKRMVRAMNEARANEVAETKAKDKALEDELNEMELKHVMEDPFINEETDFGKSAQSDYRVRPDHFKGYSSDQVKYIFQENDVVVAEHKKAKQEEKDVDAAWGRHQDAVSYMMEQNYQAQKAQRDYMNKLQAEDIAKQRLVQAEKKAQAEKDRFGSVDGGFFKGFGSSCR